MEYFLGVDIGGTKSQALLANASGEVLGFGQGGPGNWEDVGYQGLAETLDLITRQALAQANVSREQIDGAGFGIAGYDWQSQWEAHMTAIRTLGLVKAHLELVNDTIIGLVGGSAAGWGIAIVAGTRANCWGLDRQGGIGRMTGYGVRMAEAAGGLEIVGKAVQAVAKEWTRRGPPTRLTRALIEWAGARDIEDLLEGVSLERIPLDASAAPRVFQVAEDGDAVANDIMVWAGNELASLAIGVIHQLSFETLEFDAVLIGSIHHANARLTQTMQNRIHTVAPGARFVPLIAPPAIGGVLLAMQEGGEHLTATRARLMRTASKFLVSHNTL